MYVLINIYRREGLTRATGVDALDAAYAGDAVEVPVAGRVNTVTRTKRVVGYAVAIDFAKRGGPHA